jgi:hypothetical protein
MDRGRVQRSFRLPACVPVLSPARTDGRTHEGYCRRGPKQRGRGKSSRGQKVRLSGIASASKTQAKKGTGATCGTLGDMATPSPSPQLVPQRHKQKCGERERERVCVCFVARGVRTRDLTRLRIFQLGVPNTTVHRAISTYNRYMYV